MLAQMKGKAIIAKRNFCNSGTWMSSNTMFTISMEIREWGILEEDDDGRICTLIGEEYNPLEEVDQYGRDNPHQDPNRGTLPDFTTFLPTCAVDVDSMSTTGYEDPEPFSILQNLEGIDSIMGRSIVILESETREVGTCCIIAH